MKKIILLAAALMVTFSAFAAKPPLDHSVYDNWKSVSGLTEQNDGAYRGYLGVDMMVCASKTPGKYLLNPCVEINMRRTMGHAALALAERGLRGMMNFTYENGHHKVVITNEIQI